MYGGDKLIILLAILKLTEVVNMSWWWVFAPIWIPICIAVTLMMWD